MDNATTKTKFVRTPLDLKPRLLETLKLVQKGYTNKMIEEELKISNSAVVDRLAALKTATGGMNRVELAVWYTKFLLMQGPSIIKGY